MALQPERKPTSQFGTGLQIAIRIIQQQISVLSISAGIQPPNPANAVRSVFGQTQMPCQPQHVEQWTATMRKSRKKTALLFKIII